MNFHQYLEIYLFFYATIFAILYGYW